MNNDVKKSKRLTINFRDNQEEQDLYSWIKENGVIGGDSIFIKSVLYQEYLKRKGSKE